MGTPQVNPVTITLGLVVTALGSVGVWTFLAALLTRKADTKAKTVDAVTDLETASRDYRAELRAELNVVRERFTRFVGVVIPLLRMYDAAAPEIEACLPPDEWARIRNQGDLVWKSLDM